MSASERLKVLGEGLSREVIEDQIRREGWNPDYATPQKLEDVSRALRLAAYDSALPEVIAVVEAAEWLKDAERAKDVQRLVTAGLAIGEALEALGAKLTTEEKR